MSELLRDTQLAFDSVAMDYDGPLGNNALVQRIRARTMDAVRQHISPGHHLLDLGCGTGLDAESLAGEGYRIMAIDWSPQMVRRTQDRINRANLQDQVQVKHLGFHQLNQLQPESFDGVYSDLGPLNCALNLADVAMSLSKLLKPHSKIIASVIGRVCPWEWVVYLMKGQWARANLRFQRGLVAVPLNGRTLWTQYFTPREFSEIFVAAGFRFVSLRALGLFVPPPYMIRFAESHVKLINFLQRLDDGIGGWPLFRNWGDHFLIVMQKNG